MKLLVVAFVTGFLFALGLGLSGMTQPLRIQGFLDFTFGWDPTLAFVMIGAIGTHIVSLQLIKLMRFPLLGGRFDFSKKRKVDWRLYTGAAIFGVGWGLGGFCPGPALTSMGALNRGAILFVIAMLVGMGLFRFLDTIWWSRDKE